MQCFGFKALQMNWACITLHTVWLKTSTEKCGHHVPSARCAPCPPSVREGKKFLGGKYFLCFLGQVLILYLAIIFSIYPSGLIRRSVVEISLSPLFFGIMSISRVTVFRVCCLGRNIFLCKLRKIFSLA